MRLRSSWTTVVCGLLLLVPSVAAAQGKQGLRSVGGFIGREADESDDWLLFGAEARIGVGSEGCLAVQPRFTYHPFTDGSAIQLDVNVIDEFRLAMPKAFSPYLGVGGAFHRESFSEGTFSDSESKVGLNVVAGLNFPIAMNQWNVFVHTQYTFIKEFPNPYNVVVGVSREF